MEDRLPQSEGNRNERETVKPSVATQG